MGSADPAAFTTANLAGRVNCDMNGVWRRGYSGWWTGGEDRVLGSLGSAAWGYAAFSRLGGCGKQPRLETVKFSGTERGRVGRVEKGRWTEDVRQRSKKK